MHDLLKRTVPLEAMKMMSKSNLSMKTICLWLASVFWSTPSQNEIGSDDLTESSGDKSEESESEEDEVLE